MAQTQIVARDIRKIGDGSCLISATVRYNEPYQRLSTAPRLLRSSRVAAPCSKANVAADALIRKLEGQLLLDAQNRVNLDNTRVRTFTLARDVPLRLEATFRSSIIRRSNNGERVMARSMTPSWYAVTDADGNPTSGYFHVSAILAEVAEPQRVVGRVAASCNARLRAAPSTRARVLRSLPCNQPLNVMINGRDGWYEVVSADGVAQGRYINGTALKLLSQVQ